MRTLPLLRKTKTYLLARARGIPAKQANIVAGFAKTTSVTQIMQTPVAQHALEQVLQEQKEFNNDGITDRLKVMWNSEVEKKVWNETLKRWDTFSEPDKDLWKYSMDRVLDLRGLRRTKKDDEAGDNAPPTQIVFNVLNTPEVKVVKSGTPQG